MVNGCFSSVSWIFFRNLRAHSIMLSFYRVTGVLGFKESRTPEEVATQRPRAGRTLSPRVLEQCGSRRPAGWAAGGWRSAGAHVLLFPSHVLCPSKPGPCSGAALQDVCCTQRRLQPHRRALAPRPSACPLCLVPASASQGPSPPHP